MSTVDTAVHGMHPMSVLEIWMRGKCCLNLADTICSEHGRPHDRSPVVQGPAQLDPSLRENPVKD